MLSGLSLELNTKVNSMNVNSNKHRINAYISQKNYDIIDELMKTHELMSMKLSKGAIIDLALSNLFTSLDVGESLENIAIQHLERMEDLNIDKAIANPEGDFHVKN